MKPHSDLPFAFVCFNQTEQAKLCFEGLKTNPPYLDLYVNWAESKQERSRKLKSTLSQIQNETNLFVKGLKSVITKEVLLQKMQKFGEITNCEVKQPAIKG